MLPYFNGERTPVFDPDARGVIAGLTLRHTRGHLYRAICEGIAFGTRQILELLDGAGVVGRRGSWPLAEGPRAAYGRRSSRT